MGFLTTIVIHNDALGAFEKDPAKFGQAILDGIVKSEFDGQEVHVPFESYANYITVHPSRHADDDTVYLHSGNTVFQLNKYGKRFQELANWQPDLARTWIKKAQRILKDALDSIKKEE